MINLCWGGNFVAVLEVFILGFRVILAVSGLLVCNTKTTRSYLDVFVPFTGKISLKYLQLFSRLVCEASAT